MQNNHRRAAYLCLTHGNIFIHDVTDRARLLAQCSLGITRLFPLRVYLRIDTLFLRKEVVRILLRLQRRVSFDVSLQNSPVHTFFLSPICFCNAFDCLLKPLASKSTVVDISEQTILELRVRHTLHPVLVHLNDFIHDFNRVTALSLRLAYRLRVPSFVVNETGYV